MAVQIIDKLLRGDGTPLQSTKIKIKALVLANADVGIVTPDTQINLTTAADGSFTVDLEAGLYLVQIQIAGRWSSVGATMITSSTASPSGLFDLIKYSSLDTAELNLIVQELRDQFANVMQPTLTQEDLQTIADSVSSTNYASTNW